MQFTLTADQEVFATKMRRIGLKFRERAAKHDAAFDMPIDDIQDMFHEGLLLSNASKEHGGLGFGTNQNDPLAFYITIENFAYGSPGSAHCYQVHSHNIQMVDKEGTEDQRQRYFAPVIDHGGLHSGVGSEPGRTARGQYKLTTSATKVSGGYLLNGVKNYATNASMADWILVFAMLDGSDSIDAHTMFMIPKGAKGVSIDSAVWRPMGMRSTVSPTITLKNCFVPDNDVLGEPGTYRAHRWQAHFNLAFACNYIGSAQAMLDFAVDYIGQRGTKDDPYTQLRLGEVAAQLSAARLLVYSVASLWKQNKSVEAELQSNQAKYFADRTVMTALTLIPQITGSSSMFEKHPLERFVRDMHVHTLHAGVDRAAQIVGASLLGGEYDVTLQR